MCSTVHNGYLILYSRYDCHLLELIWRVQCLCKFNSADSDVQMQVTHFKSDDRYVSGICIRKSCLTYSGTSRVCSSGAGVAGTNYNRCSFRRRDKVQDPKFVTSLIWKSGGLYSLRYVLLTVSTLKLYLLQTVFVF